MRMDSFINELKIASVKVLHSNGQEGAVPTPKAVPCCHQCAAKAMFFASQVGAHGQVVKKSYCLAHASAAGLLHPQAWDLIAATPSIPQKTLPKCQCGTTAELLKLRGRAGCPQCYQFFAPLFAPVVSQVQAAPSHKGKSPRRTRINVKARIQVLEKTLQQAISVEHYEEAAQVRDEIAQLLKSQP